MCRHFLFCRVTLSKVTPSTLPKRVPRFLPSVGFENVCLCDIFAALARDSPRHGWNHSECGGTGDTQSLALGCTRDIITIRWRINNIDDIAQKCLLCRLHAPLSRRLLGAFPKRVSRCRPECWSRARFLCDMFSARFTFRVWWSRWHTELGTGMHKAHHNNQMAHQHYR